MFEVSLLPMDSELAASGQPFCWMSDAKVYHGETEIKRMEKRVGAVEKQRRVPNGLACL
jgi:hypothetical protein